MGVKLYKEPELKNPDLVCSWPGIGNIGLLAVETLQDQVRGEEIGEIDPWEFFDPHNVIINDGIIEKMEFPTSKFYHQKIKERDSLIFIGKEQPSTRGKMYASGEKAYRLANMVLDTAEKFGCRRIYTSGACVSTSHHESKPRVVAVASSQEILQELKKYPNVALMNEINEEGREGVITGLNGSLLALAKKRGMEAVCLMGEIPDWLSRAPFPYPKASKAIVEVFSQIFQVNIDFTYIEKRDSEVEKIVESLYEKFPPEVKEQYDQRKTSVQPGPITTEEAQWMKDHLDDFLKSLSEEQGGEEDDDDDDKPV